MPTPKVVAGWTAAVPPGSPSCSRRRSESRIRALRDVDESVRIFCDVARGLGARLGPLLFQLPPNFKKDPAGSATSFIWCRRSCAWPGSSVTIPGSPTTSTSGCARATLPWPSSRTTTRRRPPWHPPTGGYFRLRAVDYTDARLEAWVKTIRGVGAGWRDAFVFFKHEERGTGPALAQRLETLLAT